MRSNPPTGSKYSNRRSATDQGLGAAQRTFPAAISRKAITISRLSDVTRGLAPFRSCFARIDASCTSSKRLATLSKQSSTVILAMVSTLGLGRSRTQGEFFR
jgi:hypothetical protein